MFARPVGVLVLFACLPLWAQQPIVSVPGEPQNLNVVKQQLIRYHDCHESSCYEPQLEHQADVAISFLKQSAATAKPGEKLAVVFDVDETALSNWSVEMLDDFGYIPSNENWCVSLHCARVIPATLRIFHEAEHDKIAVFFITGRPETQYADTEANLHLEGYDHWQKLYARPVKHAASQSTEDYKSGERTDIMSQGYRIVLNVGDQLSDL